MLGTYFPEICLYLTVPENLIHFIYKDRFWFVHILFVNMVKFQCLTQFHVDPLSHPVLPVLDFFFCVSMNYIFDDQIFMAEDKSKRNSIQIISILYRILENCKYLHKAIITQIFSFAICNENTIKKHIKMDIKHIETSI